VDTFVGIDTKDSGHPETYTILNTSGLTGRIGNFTTLSDEEKLQMKDSINSLLENKFPVKNIVQLFSTLSRDEGKVAKKMIYKFKASITPVELKKEGVYRPLMSGYISGKEDLEIFLPENLETYADHGLILELLRFRSSVDHVKITRCSGELKINNEERLSQLIMGYVSELLSDQKIARVSYTRSSYYQLGRMLARAKLIQFVITDLSIPSKYVQVPQRFLGGSTEFQEPESIRTLKSLISGDVDLIDDLLKNLASHVYKHAKGQVKAKIDESLFMPFPEFVHLHERRAKVQSKKGRTGRIQTAFTTIKPTKPSTLTTIAPWEREAVQELYDKPWSDLADLEKEYNNTHPLKRTYNDLSSKVSAIINEEWSNKQILLRKTNHRLVLSDLSETTPLWQRLNKVRTVLTEFKSIETCDRDTLRRILTAYDILPSGMVTLHGGFKKSWSSAFKDNDLHDSYPATTRLIQAYHGNTLPDHPDLGFG
jgi:hypothetical protein